MAPLKLSQLCFIYCDASVYFCESIFRKYTTFSVLKNTVNYIKWKWKKRRNCVEKIKKCMYDYKKYSLHSMP